MILQHDPDVGDAVFYYAKRAAGEKIRQPQRVRVLQVHPKRDALSFGPRVDVEAADGTRHLNVPCSAETAWENDSACWQEISS